MTHTLCRFLFVCFVLSCCVVLLLFFVVVVFWGGCLFCYLFVFCSVICICCCCWGEGGVSRALLSKAGWGGVGEEGKKRRNKKFRRGPAPGLYVTETAPTPKADLH